MAVESIGSIVGSASPVATIIAGVWLFYWLLSSGRIIPKTTWDLVVSQYDKIIASKDKTIASQERQIEALTEASKTTKKVLTSLEEAGQQQAHQVAETGG